jgi:hypothetical protein
MRKVYREINYPHQERAKEGEIKIGKREVKMECMRKTNERML